MHEKKPLVPEKHFGSVPGGRCEEPLSAWLAELVLLLQTWAPVSSPGSLQAFLPAPGRAAGRAGV